MSHRFMASSYEDLMNEECRIVQVGCRRAVTLFAFDGHVEPAQKGTGARGGPLKVCSPPGKEGA